MDTYFSWLKFMRKFFSRKFMSENVRVSRSSNCDMLMRRLMFTSGAKRFCRASTTWLNEPTFSHFTSIVLNSRGGSHVHGEISRRTAHVVANRNSANSMTDGVGGAVVR